MIEEKELTENNFYNSKFANFIYSLMKTLSEIAQIDNVDDIYLNQQHYGKIEIYTFLKNNSLDDEDKIAELLTNWEMNSLYFPELFIYSAEDKKMNVLPRTAVRVC